MSAYEGYLKFGSHVIVNNAQVRGIADSAQPCPMYWLRGDVCYSMWDALGEADPYSYSTIATAPWYDPDVPASAQFFGLFATTITGVYDSTRTVAAVEGITDGGTLGRTRKAMKAVRVTGLLMGRGRTAIEYGAAWLSAALDPDGCGQVGVECGVEDVEFFADCPPERAIIQEWSDWTVAGRNEVRNPSVEVDLAHWQATGAALSLSTVRFRYGIQGMHLLSSAEAVLVENGPAVGDRVPVTADTSPTMLVSLWPAEPATATLLLTPYDAAGVALPTVTGTTVAVTPGQWNDLAEALPVPADAVTARLGLQVDAAPVGSELWVDGWSLGTLPYYVDGSLTPTDDTRFSWEGTAHDSASIVETRALISRPQTDAEYAVDVDPYRRYLKNAAVVSGPLIGATLNVGEFWAYEVEFTLVSERPWVYGKTRPITLPPSIPVVVEDITYNRAPYPSAELSSGTVTVQTNFSTNPSSETDIAGWGKTQDGVVIASAAVSAVSRSTELASVGAASAKITFTAAGASAVAGWFSVSQEVTLPAAVVANRDRYSINMWAARNIQAGAPVFGALEIEALWKNSAGGATVRTDQVGIIPGNSGAASLANIVPPVGATHVSVRVRCHLNSWNAGTIVRLYADALAVTAP